MINKAIYKLLLFPAFLLFVLTNVSANNGIENSKNDFTLNISVEKHDVRCNGEPQGIASVMIDGGLPPYDILWNTGQDNPVIDYLYAGTYSVTVTDDAGATATASIEVNEPSLMSLVSVEIIDENCNEEDGSVLFSVEGGTPPYEYEWADNSTNQNLENVSDGSYTVVVTDANNCFQKFGPYVVDSDCNPTTGPCDDGPVLTDSSVNESDCGLENGSIFLSISNVALPHTFEWTGGYDTEDLMNLAPGSYTLTLTDANDCSQEIGPFIIEEDCDIPCLLKPVVTSFIITNTDCGLENGAIDITVDGGDPPFTFSWNTNPAQNTEDIQNLAPGTYGVVITDAEGCDDKFSFEVKEDCTPEPPCVAPIIESVVVIESTCDNADGIASVNLVGGPAGYDFDWDPAVSNTFSANNLEAGTYSVTISDVTDPDCNIVEVFSVGNSDGPQPTILSTTPASCNQDNGTAVLSDLTLLYAWDNGEVGNNPTMLTAGQHLVTVTDPANGCINIIEVTIDEFTVLQASATINSQPTSGNADGSVTINVTNGSLAYSYEWPDGPGPETRDDLPAGTYSVTVTDLGITGCVVVVNFVLTNNNGVTVSVIGDPTLDCIGSMNGTVDFTLTPANADVTIEIIDMATGLPVNNGELTAGSYCMTATDNATGDIVGGDCFDLTQPSQIDADFASFPQDCDGLGSIEVVDIMGGNGGYQYNWGDNVSGNPSDMNQNGLSAGSYDVTITDALGCSITATIPVDEDGMPITIQTLTEIQPTCENSVDGSITVQGSGGTEPYVYTWNNVVGNETSPDLTGGITTLVITDAVGCSTTQTYNLEPIGALGSGTYPTDTIACESEIEFNASVQGADSYEWFDQNGVLIGTGPTVVLPVGVDPSEYTVVASSNEGCTDESSFMASGEPLNVQTDTTLALVACANEPAPLDGLISNPNPDYTYDWMPDNLIASGDGTANPVFVSGVQGANQVSVEVTNSIGCSEILSFMVGVADPNIQPAQPQASYDCQDYTVNLTIPNIYPGAMWDFGDGSPIVSGNDVVHTYSNPGSYDVIITFDPEIPCVDEIIYPVTVLEALENDVEGTDQIVCADTMVTLNAVGANGSDLTWYDASGAVIGMGDNIEVQSGMPNTGAQFYIVEATNSFNCTSTDTVFVENNQILADPFNLADLCEDEPGQAEVLLSGLSGEVNNIVWSSENTEIIFNNSSDPAMVTYSNANDGDMITATLSNDYCEFSTSSMASVYNFDPELGVDVADVVADPIEVILGDEFNFDILNSGNLIITEGEDVINQDGLYSAIPDELGNITYTFIFEDPDTGCSTTRSVTVTVVNPNCSADNIFFPNLFTPNGDGMNDILYLRGTFVEEVFFTVYDRWGEKVFESNSIDEGWDGTFKGKQLCNDVYGYYLRVRCDGQDYYQQGNVTLMH